MNARLAMIAAVALTAGSGAVAEPPKAPAKAAAQPAKKSVPIMLASADRVPTPGPTDQATQPPAKRRAARVTTCRCGDQVAEEQPEQ